MPRQIKQCAWEIYLGNMENIYGNAAVFFAIRFMMAFPLEAMAASPFLRVLGGMLWLVALAPLELWWRKSLLELVKGDRLRPGSCLSLYGDDRLCWKSILLALFCQGIALWFWGVGAGVAAGGAQMLGEGIAWFRRLTPFLFALAVQPMYVGLLLSPGVPLGRQLVSAWKQTEGHRGELLRLWLSLGGWLSLLLITNLLSLFSQGLIILLFWCIQGLACVVVAPYLTLCEIFFSLRLIKR